MPKKSKKHEPKAPGKTNKRLAALYKDGLEIPPPDSGKVQKAKLPAAKELKQAPPGGRGRVKAREWLTFNKIFFEIAAAVALTLMAVILSWGAIYLITIIPGFITPR